MTATGPDFISLQVSDLERSAAFYESHLGLTRAPGPPHAVVFATTPVAFAVRTAEASTELGGPVAPGTGVGLWLHANDVQAIHDSLAAADATIVSAPAEGPFGLTFTFADPDGYRITLHDKA